MIAKTTTRAFGALRSAALAHKRTTAGAVTGLVLVGIVLALTLGGSGASQNNPVIIVAKVEARTLQQTVQLTGTLARKNIEDVTANSQGIVNSVFATDGASVSAGQPLFELNGRDAVAEQGKTAFFRSLGIGDVGDDVLQLKQILTAANDYPGPMTNQFTEQTQFALAQWQAQNHFPNSAPATPQTVNVQLEQGAGYQLGAQASTGLTIDPPAVTTSAFGSGRRAQAKLLALPLTGTPSLSIQSVSDEVQQGQQAVFVVSDSTPPTSDTAVNLDYGGTATTSNLITPPSSVVIPAGAGSTTVDVQTRSSNVVAPSTTLIVSLASGSGYLVGSPSSAQTIIANNNVPQLQIAGSTTVAPGGAATLSVTASQAPTQDTQVALSFGGSAQPGSDYTLPDPVVTLPAGATSAAVTVNTLPSSTLGPDKYVVVALSPSSSYSIGPMGSAVVTIALSVGVPVVTLRSATGFVQKGQPAQLAIGLSSPVSTPVTVYLSFGGSAVEGVDYIAPSTAVTVPPGQTTFAVTVPTVADDVVQSNRTLSVSVLANPAYELGDPDSTSVTISSQVLPKLTISSDTPSVTQGGVASFTITADQPPTQDTSVNFAVQGTAQPGQSYQPILGEALLRAGQTQVTVDLQSIRTDVTFQPTDMIVGSWPIRVGTVYVKAGNAVTPGEPILELTEPNVSVTLQASASDRSNLQLGQHCTVEIAGGSTQVSGTITELDAAPTTIASSQPGGASSEVYEGRIDSSDLASLNGVDGSTVSISVVDKQVSGALSVPIAAVKQNGVGQDVVRVLDHNGSVSEVPVTTGLSEGSYIEVKSGLSLGDTVLVESTKA